MRNPTGDIQEGEVADHAAGFSQARGQLCRQLQQNIRIIFCQCPKTGIAYLGDFGIAARANPGTAIGVFSKQSHFTKKASRVDVGQHDFMAFLVLDQYGDRALDDVIQHIRLISRIDDYAFRRILSAVTMFQKPLDAGIRTRRDAWLFHVADMWDSVHTPLSVNMPAS